ncbi:MAG: PEP-CTERM sorting domain-containing protein [Thermoguttaceae bacterium]
MRLNVLACVFALSLAASAAMASDGTGLNWVYQKTGFQTADYQTAVAMRDGQAWPVIFAVNNSSSYYDQNVNAYSLYPTFNSATGTYWHQIGTNLLPVTGSSSLSAATSSTGQIGVVVNSRMSGTSSAAVVGSSSTGFGAAMTGVMAIAFDSHGNLIKGTANTIPSSFCPGNLLDIATSPTGDLGAIDDAGRYYQRLAWTGQWTGGDKFKPQSATWFYNADLAMDSLGRTHIVGSYDTANGMRLIASDFDIVNGWTTQTLASCDWCYFGATLAADSLGGVGAAWVQSSGSCSELMYAYKDGGDGWTIREVTTGLWNSNLMNWENVLSEQRVGLAFDANDLPVISFLASSGSGNNIYLAYDPVSAPEPSTLLLLAAAGTLWFAQKSWLRRALGKS